MQIISKICEKVSDYISDEIKCDDNKRQVINYGIFALIQMIICILLVMLFGYIFNVVVEALIVSFTISILRKGSGGAHATSPEKCAFFGTIISVVMALVSKYTNIEYKWCVILGVFVFMYGYYFVYRLAPVDSEAKPIKNQIKRQKLKKTSIIIICCYLIIILFNLIVYYITFNKVFITYSLCIYSGVLWQTLSLTKIGHIILSKLN